MYESVAVSREWARRVGVEKGRSQCAGLDRQCAWYDRRCVHCRRLLLTSRVRRGCRDLNKSGFYSVLNVDN